MATLVTPLAAICFAFAAGVFTVLSFIEKPVWSLMRDPSSDRASDHDTRLIHAELRRVIRLLPPTMKTTMSLASLLIVAQSWLRGFDWVSLTVLGVFVALMAYLLFHLESRIRAVADTPSEGEIGAVRTGVGELAALHHAGLATAVIMLSLQLWVISAA